MILRALAVVGRLAGVLAFLEVMSSPVIAAPITSVTDLANFRETRGVNNVGFGSGDFNAFGAEVVPNGAAGTRFFALQNGVRVPSSGTFACVPLAVDPNTCNTITNFGTGFPGPWSLTFVNGTDQRTELTPALTTSALTAPAPFPTSVTINGSGATPTLSWTVPAGFSPNAVRVDIFDRSQLTSAGSPNIIFAQTLPGTATSFSVPSAANLKPNTSYVFDVQLIETRNGSASTGSPNGNISERSRSFFSFSVLGPTGPPQVFLPTVGPAPNPATGLGATYMFNVTGVRGGQPIFIDPFVATGYKYATGVGNPNFASVRLPAVGDNLFLLSFLMGQSPVSEQISANTQFFFPQGGVSAFDVTGIETSAGLDPDNVTAFITGLTFVGDGDFTGTMTPLIADVPDAVPEPATFVLLGTTLGALGLVGRSRRRGEPSSS